ncbi:MAG: LytTR family DNA-binding domain-containing protein [Lysobacterales bacterium]
MIKLAFSAYLGAYRRHPSFLMATLAINAIFAAVNSASMISDFARIGKPIAWGKPVLYEVSSAIAIIIMLPLIIRAGEAWRPTRTNWLSLLPRYILATIAFSAGHVTLMVLMRKLLVPPLFGGSYEFLANGYGAILYEYWKDLRTFVLLIAGFFLLRELNAARAAKARAAPIELRSGATRILLDPADFLFAKAAANYAEIITRSGESLARVTLTELERLLTASGVDAVRVHRSILVNRVMIKRMDPLPGGDLTLTLKDGQKIRASRRFKSALMPEKVH